MVMGITQNGNGKPVFAFSNPVSRGRFNLETGTLKIKNKNSGAMVKSTENGLTIRNRQGEVSHFGTDDSVTKNGPLGGSLSYSDGKLELTRPGGRSISHDVAAGTLAYDGKLMDLSLNTLG